MIVLSNLGGISPKGLDDRVADIVLAKAFPAAKANAPAPTRVVTTRSGEGAATTLAGYSASSTGEVFGVV